MKRAFLLGAIISVTIAVPSLAAAEVLTYRAAFTMTAQENNPSDLPILEFSYDTELGYFLQADLGWEASYASLISVSEIFRAAGTVPATTIRLSPTHSSRTARLADQRTYSLR